MKGGSSFGHVLDLLALRVAVVEGCDSHAGEGSHLSPRGAESFGRVLKMAVLGLHSPSALESKKTSPPNDRLIPKMLPARLGLFCGRDFVTGLGGKSLTLG